MRVAAGALLAVIVSCVTACGSAGDDGGGDDDPRHDAALDDGGTDGDGGADGDAAVADAAVLDAPPVDAAVDAAVDARPVDARPVDAAVDAPPPIISGGPCISGAPGQTAYRIRWINGGGTAIVDYEVHGLPDTSRFRAGAYSQNIGFTPRFVDIPLGGGGLELSGTVFVDIELSTVGISQIQNAWLSIYGRSYSTGSSGSFSWQTFDGIAAVPTNHVSNVAPYRWYAGDMTPEISAGDNGVLIRLRPGPSSNSLVVSRIELCLLAS